MGVIRVIRVIRLVNDSVMWGPCNKLATSPVMVFRVIRVVRAIKSCYEGYQASPHIALHVFAFYTVTLTTPQFPHSAHFAALPIF